MGYNVLDNYAYGVIGSNVVRIHSDGTVNILFGIGYNPVAGDMDTKGNLWVQVANTRRLNRINITTKTVAYIDMDSNLAMGDFAVHSTLNMAISVYPNGRLAKTDLTTGVVTSVANALPATTGKYTAMWIDINGKFFAMNNVDGKLYEVKNYLSASPNYTLVATKTAALAGDDGFSCA
jgi:hypothetical protein